MISTDRFKKYVDDALNIAHKLQASVVRDLNNASTNKRGRDGSDGSANGGGKSGGGISGGGPSGGGGGAGPSGGSSGSGGGGGAGKKGNPGDGGDSSGAKKSKTLPRDPRSKGDCKAWGTDPEQQLLR